MWDLKTLKRLNDERVEYLQKKKAEKEAISQSAEAAIKRDRKPEGR